MLGTVTCSHQSLEFQSLIVKAVFANFRALVWGRSLDAILAHETDQLRPATTKVYMKDLIVRSN